MLKMRRPLGRLIFNMGIAIPGKTVFLIETPPWLTHILYMTTDCHYVVVHHNATHWWYPLVIASNSNRCLHRSREVILAVAPCQLSHVTPCLAICAHFLPRNVAFSRCARRRLSERVICTDNQWWPRWWRDNVPRCTVQSGDGHISVLSGALGDVWRMHCRICKTGLLLLLFDRSVQIVLRYLQYWYLYDDMTLVTVFCQGKVKIMYQQHDVLMETVKMHYQKMYMMWNKVLWKKVW